MSLIVAGVGLATSLIGGAAAKRKEAREQRKMDAFLAKRAREAEDFYRKESNTNYLDTAEGQSQYQALRRMLRENANRVDNSVVKSGATAESKVAAKAAAGRSAAEGAAAMAAAGTKRKDNLRRDYMAQMAGLDSANMSRMQARAESWSNIASNASTLGGQFIDLGAEDKDGGWAGLFDKLKKNKKDGSDASGD